MTPDTIKFVQIIKLIVFEYPPEIHHILYTINANDPENMGLRKITRNPRPLPGNKALLKLF
ncbi:hypothetical protein NTGZN8_200004 [Candidatus Nitrotoga fabula]|uniref:Transposase n=1 Tax=Candidatus Nitrotoga fabula TaxID=2182327 RepID=A0A916F9L8_9PROT|nr:hypothetical protein NTGZN8_200004 [Candidatus Nitrotoga fabula]